MGVTYQVCGWTLLDSTEVEMENAFMGRMDLTQLSNPILFQTCICICLYIIKLLREICNA